MGAARKLLWPSLEIERPRLFVPPRVLPLRRRRPRPQTDWPRSSIGVNANISSGDIATITATTTITKPTGTNNTDILIVTFSNGWSNSSSISVTSAPSGWTAVYTTFTSGTGSSFITLASWWALGSVANLGFTNTNAATGHTQGWIVVGFTGVDNTTPIDATGTTSSATATSTVTANSVTIATANAWELIALGSFNSGTWSATSFTIKQNAGANEDASLAYNTTPKATGATGTVSCSTTGSATAQVVAAAPFALRPAAGAAQVPWYLPTTPGFQTVMAM